MTRLQSYDNAAHVLSELIGYHEHLAEIYDDLASESENEMSKMLLDFLATREEKLTETLEKYEDGAPDRILKTWIQIPYPEDMDAFLTKFEKQLSNDMDPLQVYELASKADSFVEGLLSHLRDRCEVQHVKELFADLLKGEKDENIALSKAYNSLREM